MCLPNKKAVVGKAATMDTISIDVSINDHPEPEIKQKNRWRQVLQKRFRYRSAMFNLLLNIVGIIFILISISVGTWLIYSRTPLKRAFENTKMSLQSLNDKKGKLCFTESIVDKTFRIDGVMVLPHDEEDGGPAEWHGVAGSKLLEGVVTTTGERVNLVAVPKCKIDSHVNSDALIASINTLNILRKCAEVVPQLIDFFEDKGTVWTVFRPFSHHPTLAELVFENAESVLRVMHNTCKAVHEVNKMGLVWLSVHSDRVFVDPDNGKVWLGPSAPWSQAFKDASFVWPDGDVDDVEPPIQPGELADIKVDAYLVGKMFERQGRLFDKVQNVIEKMVDSSAQFRLSLTEILEFLNEYGQIEGKLNVHVGKIRPDLLPFKKFKECTNAPFDYQLDRFRKIKSDFDGIIP